MRNVFTVLVGKPEGKEQPRRLWCMFGDDIRMDLKEI
jgi:hypothetical protein